MRRVLLLLVVAAAVLALAGGIALSAPVPCGGGACLGTRGADTITGSNSGFDRIAGMEGNDTINGGLGPDEIYGDEGNDAISHSDASGVLDEALIFGDEGNDTIDVRDGGSQDTVICGPGKKDKVYFDQGLDIIHKNCEIKNP